MAVAPDGKIFLADGSNIRMVDEHGIITTVIGHQYHRFVMSARNSKLGTISR